jgi:hypothetical protein
MGDRSQPHTAESVIALLRELGVPFDVHVHENVMTCEAQVEMQPVLRSSDCRKRERRPRPLALRCQTPISQPIPSPQVAALSGVAEGHVTKNLFLKDKKRRQYLVTALQHTQVNLKSEC